MTKVRTKYDNCNQNVDFFVTVFKPSSKPPKAVCLQFVLAAFSKHFQTQRILEEYFMSHRKRPKDVLTSCTPKYQRTESRRLKTFSTYSL